MTEQRSPVTVDTLAEGLQNVICSFEAQRTKYGNLATDPKVNDVNQEIWASLANEKADDLRVLRKLLSVHGVAQSPGGDETKLTYIKRWRTLVKLPAKYAGEIAEALREPAMFECPECGGDLADKGHLPSCPSAVTSQNQGGTE